MSAVNRIFFLCLVLLGTFLAAQGTRLNKFQREKHIWGIESADSEEDPFIDGQWFTQRLDHFNPKDNRTWEQRYLADGQSYVPERRVVFLLLAEAEIDPWWMEDGAAFISFARQLGALCFQLEHRYYGASRPTSNLSTENLQYLSSLQAITDAAAFISATNAELNLPTDVKWIVFGAGYGGSLAAWLRNVYPNFVHGAVSMSAPVLAQTDFSDYFKVVAESIKADGGEGCLQAVRKGFFEVELLLRSPNGQQILNEEFNLCSPLQNASWLDLAFLQYRLADFVRVNEALFGGFNDLCYIMTDTDLGIPRQRLAELLRIEYCFAYDNNEYNEYLRRTDFPRLGGERQWFYQQCTEFGFFPSSSQYMHVFGYGFPVEFFTQRCTDVFGPDFNSTSIEAGVQLTNAMYGGLEIADAVSRIIFVHGSKDPMHALGVTRTTNLGSPAIFIEGSYGFPYTVGVLPTEVRHRIEELLYSWTN